MARCWPRDGFARERVSIADRMALVTLSLARSAWDAARRSRPPRPTALASSLVRKSISCLALPIRARSLLSLGLAKLAPEALEPGPVCRLGCRVEHLAGIAEVRVRLQPIGVGPLSKCPWSRYLRMTAPF